MSFREKIAILNNPSMGYVRVNGRLTAVMHPRGLCISPKDCVHLGGKWWLEGTRNLIVCLDEVSLFRRGAVPIGSTPSELGKIHPHDEYLAPTGDRLNGIDTVIVSGGDIYARQSCENGLLWIKYSIEPKDKILGMI